MIRLAESTISQSEMEKVSDWLRTNPQLTKGPMVRTFEEKFANYIGTKHCVMVNSGSSANLLMAFALKEGGYLKNNKVVIPAVSWITSLSPFLQFGYDIFLCDCDPSNLGVNLEMLEELFKKENPSLLILVHVLAHLSDMVKVNDLCSEYNVILIEDACEALGTSLNGKKAGNLSLAGSFSFYYGHHISTVEGGAITTNDTYLYNLMLSIRSHGWSRDVDLEYQMKWRNEFDIDELREYYSFYYPGFNLRPTEINAYFGIMQLDNMDFIVSKREDNFNTYSQLLGKQFWKQNSSYDKLSSFAYGLIVKNRLEVFNFLKENYIECRPLICGSMGLQPFFIKKYGRLNLKYADIIHEYGLYLPNHIYLDREEIKYICEKVCEVAVPMSIL